MKERGSVVKGFSAECQARERTARRPAKTQTPEQPRGRSFRRIELCLSPLSAFVNALSRSDNRHDHTLPVKIKNDPIFWLSAEMIGAFAAQCAGQRQAACVRIGLNERQMRHDNLALRLFRQAFQVAVGGRREFKTIRGIHIRPAIRLKNRNVRRVLSRWQPAAFVHSHTR